MSVPIEQNGDNNQLNSIAKALCQLFEDADAALTEYKKSKSPSSSAHFSEILNKIPENLNELKLAVGSDPFKQRIVYNTDVIVQMGIRLLTELRAEADEANRPVFRAHHMYRDSHTLSQRINDELACLNPNWTPAAIEGVSDQTFALLQEGESREND